MAYDDLHLRASVGLPASPRSPGEAREFIRDFCLAAGLDADVCQKAALLVSELVTNAVLHGRTRATLVAERPGGCLRIWVEDANPARPRMPTATAEDESGRGMRIVAKVADRWGVEDTARGKSVWFEIDL